MTILIAASDDEIAACHPVMRELRPQFDRPDPFVARVRAQQAQGYRLAYLADPDGQPVAVAGFRIIENLAWGRFLYVDDLVTAAGARSSGHGARLLDWLVSHGRAEGCTQLHLDSGLQRTAAHRFYERNGVPITHHHFSRKLG